MTAVARSVRFICIHTIRCVKVPRFVLWIDTTLQHAHATEIT